MTIKYGKLGNLLANLMYKDKMTAYRGESSINPDGSKSSKLLNSFLQNEPCLVHEKTKDSSKDGNMDVSRQEVVITVHCSNSHNIVRGDVLILSILDDSEQIVKKITGRAAQPCHYPDHLEIDLYDWKVS